uniref:Interleukin 6 cytokine family signal transducer n=1 Tax=Homo sapiens TaxID=9606 RepID=A0A8V8TNI8_HUMAN
MLTLQTWLVQALFIFLTTESTGELLDPCGYISPESPVVQLHSNFTAVCVLKEKCMDYFHVNANYIVWKTNHFTIPKEQYTIINRTASSVTFTDIASLNIQLTCNILTFGQLEQNVYGITIISGWQHTSLLIAKQNVTPPPHALLIILLCILSTLKSG